MMNKEIWKKIKVFFGFGIFVTLVSFWLCNNLFFYFYFLFFIYISLPIILSKKIKNLDFFKFFQGQNSRPKN